MSTKYVYICGAGNNRKEIDEISAAIAELVEEITSVRGVIQEEFLEFCDCSKDERAGVITKQVSERTSILIVVAFDQIWQMMTAIKAANLANVPIIGFCPEDKFQRSKITFNYHYHRALVGVVPYPNMEEGLRSLGIEMRQHIT